MRIMLLLTCSGSGGVLTDVAAHLPDDTLAGWVYVGSFPYFVGPGAESFLTPVTLEVYPKTKEKRDVHLFGKAREEFFDACFMHPRDVPFAMKALWLGSCFLNLSRYAELADSRVQQPEKLRALGAKGFPLLMICGTEELLVNNEGVVREMSAHFTNREVVELLAGHSIMVEAEAEMMSAIQRFCSRIGTGSKL